MAVRVNECIELLVLVLWACCGIIIDFNLGLILYCISRQALPRLLQNWLKTDKGWGRGNLGWMQVNILLLPFTIFLCIRMSYSGEPKLLLFLILLANRLFRN